MFSSLQRAAHSADINCGPLSLVIAAGRPNRCTQPANRAAAKSAAAVEEIGTASGHLVVCAQYSKESPTPILPTVICSCCYTSRSNSRPDYNSRISCCVVFWLCCYTVGIFYSFRPIRYRPDPPPWATLATHFFSGLEGVAKNQHNNKPHPSHLVPPANTFSHCIV